ncbi:Por secretion system C-terminal sorting domain-containing protein [Mesonia phycicola]|uniref:Por secretion system C-terminal sorting domain-containing protein n=1 Tax=Mesonia phycicola TaxID=579105 RepID=A0A1M6H310_9FLAO|nr:T9SS type A sorting domain-containing protein [Mesonia phycicola]SHJ16575.1 Por secretion system C-terminal sorting domain-containing protein [Mesonia phycicola]
MMKNKYLNYIFTSIAIVIFHLPFITNAQSGPGGVGSDTDNRFWFIANSLSATTNNGATVNTVFNYGGNSNNATQGTASRRPTFSTNQLNGFPILEFDGSNDYLSIADNTDLDTGGPWAQRTYSFVIRTGADVTTRQNIYNEGGSTRGFNVYIDNGLLYIGALNLNNDGADAPWGFTSANTSITANTEYIITFTFNGNTSMTGTIDTYLNGVLFGTLTGIGRVYNHNPANLGAQVNDGYYHDGGNNNSNHFFQGGLAEFIFYNKVLNTSELNSLENYLSSKYDISIGSKDVYTYDNATENFDYHYVAIQRETSSDNHLATSIGTGMVTITENDALADNDLLAIATDTFDNSELETLSYGCTATNKSLYKLTSNWRAQKTGSFTTADFSLSLDDFGTTFTSEEVILLVSNDAAFTSPTETAATNISGNIATFENITINNGDYISFAVSQLESGDYIPGGVTSLLNTRFWYQASNLSLSNNTAVSTWANQGPNGLPLEQASASRQPIYTENQMNGFPSVVFDGTNDILQIDDNLEINIDEPYSNRTFTMVFNSGSDITSTQILYEEGGNTRSLLFFIKNGNLTFAAYNQSNDGAGSPWNYTDLDTPISANTDYVLNYVYNGNSTTTGTIDCYLNGALVGTINNIGLLYAHTGDISIGGNGSNTIIVDGSSLTANTSYFEGSITEFTMYDLSLNSAQVGVLQNYYSAKYDLSLSTNDLFAYDSTTEGDFDHNLVGLYNSTTDIKNQSFVGTGIINISNPSNLDAGEHLLIASNREEIDLLDTDDIDCSSTLADDQKLATVWRVDEGGETGTVDLSLLLDQISLSSSIYSSIELIISSSSNFSSPTLVTGSIGCNKITFSGINFTDGDYFTIRYNDVQPITWDGTTYTNGSGTNGAPSAIDKGRKLVILNPSATLTEDASVGCIHIASGADATVDTGVELAIQQDIYNLGSFDASQAQLVFNGYLNQSLTGDSMSIGNLEIDNPNGVTIGLNTDEYLYIDDVLTVTNGTLSTGDQLYLRCDFTNGAAQIGEVGGIISGNVITEQCFPAKRAFRFITSSVTTSANIKANWQEGATAYNDDPTPGYGTHITGTTIDQTDGFDATPSGNPSMFSFNNSTSSWVNIADTDNTNLIAGVPYRLLVRGDRSIDVTSNTAAPTNTIIRNTGSVLTGDVTQTGFNTTDGVANFFGNPYHAAVNMQLVMSNINTTNVDSNFYYVYDPDLGGTPVTGTPGGRGGYVTVDLSDGSNSNTSSNANQYLQPMQAAFFLSGSAGTTTSLAFTEANKAVQEAATSVFRSATTTDTKEIRLQLFTQDAFTNNQTSSDGLRIKFSNSASNAVNNQDAPKFFNLDENLARIEQGSYLSIENRELPQEGEVLQLFTNQYRYTDYTFQIEIPTEFEKEVYLEDAYLQTSTLLTSGLQTINFQVDETIAESIASDRFSISFGKSTLDLNNFDTKSISVYPNPVEDQSVYILLPEQSGSNIQVEIYNVLGQKIYNRKATPESNGTLQLNSVPFGGSGIYFLKVKDTDSQQVYETKLIKS